MEIQKTLVELSEVELINCDGGARLPSLDDFVELAYRAGRKVGKIYRDIYDAARGYVDGVRCAIAEEFPNN